MGLRLVPRIMLWIMLTVSALGSISLWIRPEAEESQQAEQMMLEQQMAISTAANFIREWMTWSGEETSEERGGRLKPYVNRSDVARFSFLQPAGKETKQTVLAVEFVSLQRQGNGRYTVRLRAVVLNPARSIWYVEVPVGVRPEQGAAVMDLPVLLPVQEPPELPDEGQAEPHAASEVKLRMRPSIEGFLKAMCAEAVPGNLANYVDSDRTLIPLQGRVQWVSLDDMQVYGSGPYTVRAMFTVRDAATGTVFPQVWKLRVKEDNQKFFVQSIG